MEKQTIRVISEKCIGCQECVNTCSFSCIRMEEGIAKIDEDCCQLCRACLTVCGPDAIVIIEQKALERLDKSQYKGVMIFAEQRRGLIAPITYELLGKGRELADKLKEELSCILLGNNIREKTVNLIQHGADRIYLYDSQILEVFREDPYADIISTLVSEVKPSILLFGGTSIGKSLAPMIAARLETGLTADCTGLDIDEKGNLVQTRPAFGGNIMATILCKDRRPQMATVRYKIMDEAKKDLDRKGEVIEKKVSDKLLDRTRVKEIIMEEDRGPTIEEADIIVSGGRGLNKPEDLKLIRELAEALGGAVGASRPIVDEGWISRTHQVGLSGKSVRPKIYIAVGISGSVQHLAGMRNSDVIIAINKDSTAPIFDTATYSIEGDLYQVIPELIKEIKRIKPKAS